MNMDMSSNKTKFIHSHYLHFMQYMLSPSMDRRMRTVHHSGLNKCFGSKLQQHTKRSLEVINFHGIPNSPGLFYAKSLKISIH